MSDYGHEFWVSNERYHDLAEMFERNIHVDRRAYDCVTSRRMCSCLDIPGIDTCAFPLNGKVVRMEYRGPDVQNI